MKKIHFSAMIMLFIYLFFYPVAIQPEAWTPPPKPSLTEGEYMLTGQMVPIERLFDQHCHKCEDLAIDSMGYIYGAQEDGKILRFKSRESDGEIFADTGGRPLGMMFNKKGDLIIADADKGMLSIDTQGEITVLVDSYKGHKFIFTDDLDIDSFGVIYFTDASKRFDIRHFKEDLMEHKPNGWFFKYDPQTDETQLLMDSLYFANGVALSKDEDFVLVNETGKYRIKRLWLKGPKKGQVDIFKENLPAFNDGISSYGGDIFWVSMVSPRTDLLEGLMPKPFIRKLVMRLPDFVQPAPEKFALVIGLDHTGNVVHVLQDPEATFTSIANVIPYKDGLYFGSLTDNGVGYYQFED